MTTMMDALPVVERWLGVRFDMAEFDMDDDAWEAGSRYGSTFMDFVSSLFLDHLYSRNPANERALSELRDWLMSYPCPDVEVSDRKGMARLEREWRTSRL